MIWATLDRHRMLAAPARIRLAGYLDEYAQTKGLFVRARYANADHVHALLDPGGIELELEGTVVWARVEPGQAVNPGDVLLVIE